jgi:hypothetical protein
LKSPLIPLLRGLAFIGGAVAINVQQRALQRDDLRDIAGLRAELDSVRSALARATAAPDSVRLEESIAGRTYILGRREFHVPSRQEAIEGWWALTGPGTALSAVGALLLVAAAFSGRVQEDARLRAVKLIHTIAWAFFASCVVLIPFAASQRRFGLAGLLIAVVAIESLVLVVNSWRCPLTDVAARYTEDRGPNFDIYLPQWLARYNKEIFGSLYGGGILWTLLAWFSARA